MSKLNTQVNIAGHDDIYQMLVDLHADKSQEQSQKINAKLVVTMINQIGCPDTVKEIIELVKTNEAKY